MASKQSGIVANMYRAFLASPGEDAILQGTEQWDALTAEPGGLDYAEVEIAGVTSLWAVPKKAASGPVLLCIHGGGFVSGSIYSHRKMFAHIAKAVGARALIVGYHLLPEGHFPVPVDDVVQAYRWLLEQGTNAKDIVLIGDSVGGWLTIAAQLRARELGLPLPAAAVPLSPSVDLEVNGESMRTNAGKDALFNQAWIKQLVGDFLGETSPRDPTANPLYADLAGLGPLYIQVGDQELLLDDSRMLAEHARRSGVEVRLDIFEGQQHTFQMAAGRAPEADDAIARIAEWVRATVAGTVQVA
jgi:epsilon-lactone hydrolase